MKKLPKFIFNINRNNPILYLDDFKPLIQYTVNKPRLSVYKSNKHIYAQIIDDQTSKTLVSCSTLNRNIKFLNPNGRTCKAARMTGIQLAQFCLKKNITQIVFDRKNYPYHGRIKALADGAREGGLLF